MQHHVNWWHGRGVRVQTKETGMSQAEKNCMRIEMQPKGTGGIISNPWQDWGLD